MNEKLTQMVPDPWQSLFQIFTIPLSWIPEMQKSLLDFVLSSATGWLAGLYYLLLLFPVLLWIGAVWCSHLTIYTIRFGCGRIELVRMLLWAWLGPSFGSSLYLVVSARSVS